MPTLRVPRVLVGSPFGLRDYGQVMGEMPTAKFAPYTGISPLYVFHSKHAPRKGSKILTPPAPGNPP